MNAAAPQLQSKEHIVFAGIREFYAPEPVIQELRRQFPEWTLEHFPGSTKAEDVPAETWQKTTILVTSTCFPDPHTQPSPLLKLIQLSSAGADRIFAHPLYLLREDIAWCTSSGIHGPQIAEHVFLTLLLLTHQFPRHTPSPQDTYYSWPRRNSAVHDLTGMKLAILGYGAIGRQVARVGKAFGVHEVRVLTYSVHDTPESRREGEGRWTYPGIGDPDGLIPNKWYSQQKAGDYREFLSGGVDILVITAPLTPATKGIVDEAALEILCAPREGESAPKIHNGPYIVNISRGALLHLEPLEKFLRQGRLSGACLDVTDPEPLPRDSGLWELKNVVLTPHISGSVGTGIYFQRVGMVLKKNLERIQQRGGALGEGEGRLVNEVSRERGY